MVAIVAKHAAVQPDQPALTDEDGVTTWSELDQRVNRLVHALRAVGVGQGSTIAALLPNRREYFEVLLAAAHGGFSVVPVNWHWVQDEVAYVLADARAVVLVADARYGEVAVGAVAQAATSLDGGAGHELVARVAVGGAIEGFQPYEDLLATGSPDEPEDQTVGGPMFYTSGTTGRPKGVRTGYLAAGLPVAVLEMMGAGFLQSTGYPAEGVTLLDGPLYHSAQWAFSVLPLLAGSQVVIRHHFDPARTLETIDRYGVTNVHLVPTQMIRLLRLPDDVRAGFDGSSLQVVLHGAAPCPLDVKRRMLDWWGLKIVEYYGATEGGIVSLVSAEQWLAKPGTLGPPLATMEVRIVGDDGAVLGPGEAGTIYVRNLMGLDFEYHGDPAKTAKAHLEPGVFTLGDIGYLDDDGWLFMSDRKIDMIISGGVNIYPAEIEGVLVAHPAVRDAAVFGVPDEEYGEAVKAAVELDDGFEPGDALAAELIAYCRASLAGYKAPKSVDFEEALPRHPTGKLYKRLLRDRHWEGTGRAI